MKAVDIKFLQMALQVKNRSTFFDQKSLKNYGLDFMPIDADYIYGWNLERFYRFRISKTGIRIYRKFPNLLKKNVKGVIAVSRFIICQTDTELVSICNAHGFILQRTPAIGPVLPNVTPFLLP